MICLPAQLLFLGKSSDPPGSFLNCRGTVVKLPDEDVIFYLGMLRNGDCVIATGLNLN